MPTNEAAALEPGRLGMVIVVDLPPVGREGPPPTWGMDEVCEIVGFVRHHHQGMYTGPPPKVL